MSSRPTYRAQQDEIGSLDDLDQLERSVAAQLSNLGLNDASALLSEADKALLKSLDHSAEAAARGPAHVGGPDDELHGLLQTDDADLAAQVAALSDEENELERELLAEINDGKDEVTGCTGREMNSTSDHGQPTSTSLQQRAPSPTPSGSAVGENIKQRNKLRTTEGEKFSQDVLAGENNKSRSSATPSSKKGERLLPQESSADADHDQALQELLAGDDDDDAYGEFSFAEVEMHACCDNLESFDVLHWWLAELRRRKDKEIKQGGTSTTTSFPYAHLLDREMQAQEIEQTEQKIASLTFEIQNGLLLKDDYAEKVKKAMQKDEKLRVWFAEHNRETDAAICAERIRIAKAEFEAAEPVELEVLQKFEAELNQRILGYKQGAFRWVKFCKAYCQHAAPSTSVTAGASTGGVVGATSSSRINISPVVVQDGSSCGARTPAGAAAAAPQEARAVYMRHAKWLAEQVKILEGYRDEIAVVTAAAQKGGAGAIGEIVLDEQAGGAEQEKDDEPPCCIGRRQLEDMRKSLPPTFNKSILMYGLKGQHDQHSRRVGRSVRDVQELQAEPVPASKSTRPATQQSSSSTSSCKRSSCSSMEVQRRGVAFYWRDKFREQEELFRQLSREALVTANTLSANLQQLAKFESSKGALLSGGGLTNRQSAAAPGGGAVLGGRVSSSGAAGMPISGAAATSTTASTSSSNNHVLSQQEILLDQRQKLDRLKREAVLLHQKRKEFAQTALWFEKAAEDDEQVVIDPDDSGAAAVVSDEEDHDDGEIVPSTSRPILIEEEANEKESSSSVLDIKKATSKSKDRHSAASRMGPVSLSSTSSGGGNATGPRPREERKPASPRQPQTPTKMTVPSFLQVSTLAHEKEKINADIEPDHLEITLSHDGKSRPWWDWETAYFKLDFGLGKEDTDQRILKMEGKTNHWKASFPFPDFGHKISSSSTAAASTSRVGETKASAGGGASSSRSRAMNIANSKNATLGNSAVPSSKFQPGGRSLTQMKSSGTRTAGPAGGGATTAGTTTGGTTDQDRPQHSQNYSIHLQHKIKRARFSFEIWRPRTLAFVMGHRPIGHCTKGLKLSNLLTELETPVEFCVVSAEADDRTTSMNFRVQFRVRSPLQCMKLVEEKVDFYHVGTSCSSGAALSCSAGGGGGSSMFHMKLFPPSLKEFPPPMNISVGAVPVGSRSSSSSIAAMKTAAVVGNTSEDLDESIVVVKERRRTSSIENVNIPEVDHQQFEDLRGCAAGPAAAVGTGGGPSSRAPTISTSDKSCTRTSPHVEDDVRKSHPQGGVGGVGASSGVDDQQSTAASSTSSKEIATAPGGEHLQHDVDPAKEKTTTGDQRDVERTSSTSAADVIVNKPLVYPLPPLPLANKAAFERLVTENGNYSRFWSAQWCNTVEGLDFMITLGSSSSGGIGSSSLPQPLLTQIRNDKPVYEQKKHRLEQAITNAEVDFDDYLSQVKQDMQTDARLAMFYRDEKNDAVACKIVFDRHKCLKQALANAEEE
ncbi:unnamed protein product [Amoebophrya sp. A120]|nr:unnamed protein product [Amoebophrya sp. A120]|eukprot:GSA120T00005830001.1